MDGSDGFLQILLGKELINIDSHAGIQNFFGNRAIAILILDTVTMCPIEGILRAAGIHRFVFEHIVLVNAKRYVPFRSVDTLCLQRLYKLVAADL